MNLNRLILLCCIFHFIVSGSSGLAQSPDLNQLKEVTKSKKHDTIKLQALSDLSWFSGDIKDAKKYAFDELILAKKIKNQKWISQAYNDIGITFQKIAAYDSSLVYYSKSLAIRQKLKDDLLIASTLSKMALIYNERGEYQKSIEVQFKVLEIFEKKGDNYQIGVTLNNIGVIYGKLKNHPKSIAYTRKAITYYDPVKDEYYLAQCYGNLGFSYQNLKKLEESTKYYTKALKVFIKYGDKESQAGVENGIGLNYRDQKKLSPALEHYKRAYELSIETGHSADQVLYAHNISVVLKLQGKYTEAEKYMLDALKETDTSNKAQLAYTFRQLASLYSYMNKGEKADYYLTKYSDLKEKLFNETSAKGIAEFEVKYDSEKTKRALAEERAKAAEDEIKLESGRRWLLLSISLLIILGLCLLLVYRIQKNRRKELELNKELEKTILEKDFADEKIRIARELHDNIGSHLTFMISSLDNLAYIENPEQKLNKVADLSNFGRLTMKDLRDTIWAMNHDGGSFEQLIARVSELRSVLPSNLFVTINSNIENSKALNGLQLLNCYRILQEFIQNTIKYANASEININFKEGIDKFTIEISDNGAGFDTTNINFGNGILNMKRRCEDLFGEFSISSSDKGTQVVCEMPY